MATPTCALERRYWLPRAPPYLPAGEGAAAFRAAEQPPGAGQRSQLPAAPAPSRPLSSGPSITRSSACDWPRGTAQRSRHSSRRWPRVGRVGSLLPTDWAMRGLLRSDWLPLLRGSSPLGHLICRWCRPPARWRLPLASRPVTQLNPRLLHDFPPPAIGRSPHLYWPAYCPSARSPPPIGFPTRGGALTLSPLSHWPCREEEACPLPGSSSPIG